VTLAVIGADKSARERLQEFLRIYASVNTRLAYATDLGIPLDWVPGYTPPDPNRRRGRKRAAPTGLEWLNWCGANGFTFADVRVEHVERWLDELAAAGYSDATRGRMLSAVSAFYAKYLLREGLATQNPVALVDRRAQHLNKPAGTPSTTKRWSFQACRALLMAAYLLADRSRDGVRDRANWSASTWTTTAAPRRMTSASCACTARAARTAKSPSRRRSPTPWSSTSRPASPQRFPRCQPSSAMPPRSRSSSPARDGASTPRTCKPC
jgi:hypothetical protein